MVFPTGAGEATNSENMKYLYASLMLCGAKEEADITFLTWKGVDEYQETVDLTSLSSNFAAVFPEVASLLNPRVERTVILNDITQEKKW